MHGTEMYWTTVAQSASTEIKRSPFYWKFPSCFLKTQRNDLIILYEIDSCVAGLQNIARKLFWSCDRKCVDLFSQDQKVWLITQENGRHHFCVAVALLFQTPSQHDLAWIPAQLSLSVISISYCRSSNLSVAWKWRIKVLHLQSSFWLSNAPPLQRWTVGMRIILDGDVSFFQLWKLFFIEIHCNWHDFKQPPWSDKIGGISFSQPPVKPTGLGVGYSRIWVEHHIKRKTRFHHMTHFIQANFIWCFCAEKHYITDFLSTSQLQYIDFLPSFFSGFAVEWMDQYSYTQDYIPQSHR